ncbi:hypothetical protein ACHQM5_001837 [Ranunculus cassubicifolius]
MVRSIKSAMKLRRKKPAKKTGDSSSSSSSAVPAIPAKVWQPGVDKIGEDEELQCDPSAYNSLHAFHIGWPCLSFDVVRDQLGLIRTEFPHTLYGVAGTQAENSVSNYIGMFKLSRISGKRRDLVPNKINGDESEMGSDDDSSSSDEDEDEGQEPPILQLRKVKHPEGGLNRIRAMPQSPHICATWADTGHVEVWDFTSHLNALAEMGEAEESPKEMFSMAPIIKFGGHKDEGFAIDWSPLVPGRLLSGDCKKAIHLWEPLPSGTWKVDDTPFLGHKASVEDLQWSPSEDCIFASCSADGTFAIWDTRLGKKPAASIEAHKADVNVISWNRLASCMLATGSDDGTFSIHDLRLLKGDSRVAHFEYHKQPITSIEWSPHETSTLAVSSADHQLTIWDLSLERDEEEEAEFVAEIKKQAHAPDDLPPQLLFVHQGQKELKELHWHPQVPGMLLSTASDGFNVLMPSNIENTLPSEPNA